MMSKARAASVLLTLPVLSFAVPANYSSFGTRAAAKSWALTDKYEGAQFFDQWDFFSQADPTHGMVNYLPADQAKSKGLAKVNNNVVTLSVDSTTKLTSGQNRNSVRISSKKTYNGGLFIADFTAMPLGCSTWPAYWSVGPNWPGGGEIDVLEGVHESKSNQMTMHTSGGCTLDKSKAITGSVIGTTCESSGSSNAGCATSDPNGFGQAFNQAGGGVFAHLWDNSVGIQLWHWSRDKIPADVKSQKPNPSSWGKPVAFLATGGQCNVGQHFKSHVLTINTALCGDWAGATYAKSGCPGTCADAVANPDNFKDAQWKINYIHVYN